MNQNIKKFLTEWSEVLYRCGFVLMLCMSCAGLLFQIIRGYHNMENAWSFDIGMDVIALGVSVIIFYSCGRAKGYDFGQTGSFSMFAVLVISNSFGLFLDECCWIVQGIPEFALANRIANALLYANNYTKMCLFWQYAGKALHMRIKVINVTKTFLVYLYPVSLVLSLSNLFVPLFFSVDDGGVYQRGTFFLLSMIFPAIILPPLLAGIITADSGPKEKMIIGSFVLLPVATEVVSVLDFGVSTQQAASLLSIVLIYCVIVSEYDKKMKATQTELNMAAQIQAGMMPHTFPPFPEREEFDIFASMEPAKDVGGDFYDFFMIDEDHLCVVVADVSGKGIPASLFMMASKIILQSCAMLGRSPAEILNKTNQAICSNNPKRMFITVWLGILELSTGKMTASNAGHEYPALMHPGGKFEKFKDKHGFVVGGSIRSRYTEYEIQLQPGTKLFVYTDGVPEAANEKGEMFGMERMLTALNIRPDDEPKAVLHHVRQSVRDFVMDAEQFDDLTMLCLEYKGRQKTD